jgi:predicted TIM-barrel fold metal-dependent hydrolase
VLAMQEVPLGRRHFWPIYAACERHGLPLGIHAGSAYRNPVTALGWPTWYIEDYAAQAPGFQSQMASLITEGVLAKHPGLKVVLIESGVTWLPGFLWRFGKFWRGLRTEVPWVDRAPWEIVRDHFRLTSSRLMRPTIRTAWNGPSSTCVQMIYCSTRRTIRTGSSTATKWCPRAFRPRCNARSRSTIRSRPTSG